MFDNIAPAYDFLNRLLSLNIDKCWRKQLRKLLDKSNSETVLDVATGTGDLAIECARNKKRKIIGIDIAEKMLAEGRKKIEKKKLQAYIELKYGDGENIDFETNTFDSVIVGFGVRNFENLEKGLSEMHRVTKPNGKVFILDFSMPRNRLLLWFYKFYFFCVLPTIGKLFSKNKYAYKYLPESVSRFPQYEEMNAVLSKTGYSNIFYKPLTFGIATIYSGQKL